MSAKTKLEKAWVEKIDKSVKNEKTLLEMVTAAKTKLKIESHEMLENL